MKTQWFSILSVAGIILLSGSAFGGELRWKKPVSSAAVVPSVTHIPTVVSLDELFESSEVVQVQRSVPILPPPVEPHDFHFFYNPPPGATIQNVPPTLLPGTVVRSVPTASGQAQPRGQAISCSDQITLKSIRDISHDIRPTIAGELPVECIIDSTPYMGRHFQQSCFMWKASALSTRAAYFEHVQLERYGNTIVHPALQPVASGARFFATVPVLPIKMVIRPPSECVYTLGHYRAGNRTPYMVEPCLITPR